MADGNLGIWLALGTWLIAVLFSLALLGPPTTALILLCSLPAAVGAALPRGAAKKDPTGEHPELRLDLD